LNDSESWDMKGRSCGRRTR